MKQIWKFPIPKNDEAFSGFEIEMPVESKIVRVGTQTSESPLGETLSHPCFWALVDPEKSKYAQKFFVVGTGHKIDRPAFYQGSFTTGPFEWHLFSGESM